MSQNESSHAIRSQLTSEVAVHEAICAFLEAAISGQQRKESQKREPDSGDDDDAKWIPMLLDGFCEIAIELAKHPEARSKQSAQQFFDQIFHQKQSRETLITIISDGYKQIKQLTKLLIKLVMSLNKDHHTDWPVSWAVHCCDTYGRQDCVEVRDNGEKIFKTIVTSKNVKQTLDGQRVQRILQEVYDAQQWVKGLLKDMVAYIFEPVFWHTDAGLTETMKTLEQQLLEYDAKANQDDSNIHDFDIDGNTVDQTDREKLVLQLQFLAFLELSRQSMTPKRTVQWSHTFLGMFPPWSMAYEDKTNEMMETHGMHMPTVPDNGPLARAKAHAQSSCCGAQAKTEPSLVKHQEVDYSQMVCFNFVDEFRCPILHSHIPTLPSFFPSYLLLPTYLVLLCTTWFTLSHVACIVFASSTHLIFANAVLVQ